MTRPANRRPKTRHRLLLPTLLALSACGPADECPEEVTARRDLSTGDIDAMMMEGPADVDITSSSSHRDNARVRCWCLSATTADCIVTTVFEPCDHEIYADATHRTLTAAGGPAGMDRLSLEDADAVFDVCTQRFADAR